MLNVEQQSMLEYISKIPGIDKQYSQGRAAYEKDPRVIEALYDFLKKYNITTTKKLGSRQRTILPENTHLLDHHMSFYREIDETFIITAHLYRNLKKADGLKGALDKYIENNPRVGVTVYHQRDPYSCADIYFNGRTTNVVYTFTKSDIELTLADRAKIKPDYSQ